MNRLKRNQRKGKVCSYTSRFLKKKLIVASYSVLEQTESEKILIGFKRVNKSNAVLAILQDKSSKKKYYLPCPKNTRTDTVVNSEEENSLKIKKLKDIEIGTLICGIEYYKDRNKYYATSAGAFGKILAKDPAKKIVKVGFKKREIWIKEDNKASIGIINSSNMRLKPLGKAGNGHKLSKSKGKKHAKVSSHKMNVLMSPIGGSYRKRKRIKCVTHNTSPGKKCGHISPARTGRKKV